MTQAQIQQLVKQKHLTSKQGKNLPPAFALKVGLANKKKGRKPKPSMSKEAWATKKKNKNKK